MKKIIINICFTFIAFLGNAQDFHLTQFEEAQLRLNPALAGREYRDGSDYRISNLYRSQWSQVSTKPYSTVYLAYDTQYHKRWGIGAHLINNQAGAPTFRTFNFMVSGSYDIINDPFKEHILTAGLQLGVMNKSFRTDQLVFDSQYSEATGQFDPTLNSGENIATSNIYRFDAGMGMFYRYRPLTQNYSPFVGFSAGHISFPNQNFFTEKEATPMIWRFNTGIDLDLNEGLVIQPIFLMMFQKKAREFLMNVNSIYQFKNQDYDLRILLGYRVRDAFVSGIGMRYKNFIGMISYDVNTSYLSNYTNGRGGFEFRLSYQGVFQSGKIKDFMHEPKSGVM